MGLVTQTFAVLVLVLRHDSSCSPGSSYSSGCSNCCWCWVAGGAVAGGCIGSGSVDAFVVLLLL